MTTAHDPGLIERLAEAIGPLHRGHDVREWPPDEAVVHRTCDYRSFSDRGEQLDRYRCRKVVTQILDLLATEGRLAEPPAPPPEPVKRHGWDVKDGCW